MSSVVASPSEQLRRLIVQVFWHQVDPQPELAFPFPNDSFYEVQARLDRIVDTLVADERFKLNELTLEAVDLAEARRHITSVHDDRFFDWLQTVFEKGGRQPVVADIIPPSRYHVRLPSNGNPAHLAGFWGYDSWTPVMERTFDAAVLSALCAVRAAHAIDEHSRITYALCRPPGHHASDHRYGGYCYFNNAAVAARSLQASDAARRVAILDIDYHHGNGTQDIFYEDPSVFYCSLHADPDHGGEPYFSGYGDEVGHGEGVGTNLNLPLTPPITDEGYMATLKKATDAIRAFAPDTLIVSLGVDILRDDPLALLGGISLELFKDVGRELRALNMPTLVVQEGGYHPNKVGTAVHTFFCGLLGDS